MDKVLVVSADGRCHAIESSALPRRDRHHKGVTLNPPAVAILSATDADDLVVVTAAGKMNRTAVSEYRAMGRTASGVRCITLAGGDTVVAATVTKR